MFSVEVLAVSDSHPGHLDVGYDKASLLDHAYDLADVLVAIWLDHRERPDLPGATFPSALRIFCG